MLLDDFESSLQPRVLHRLEDSSQPYTEKIKFPTYLSIISIAKPEGLNSNLRKNQIKKSALCGLLNKVVLQMLPEV